MTIVDYTVIAEAIVIVIWHISVSWRKYTRKRFTAQLKYGNDWYVKDYQYYSIGMVPKDV